MIAALIAMFLLCMPILAIGWASCIFHQRGGAL
jgi:hypothetical protein